MSKVEFQQMKCFNKETIAVLLVALLSQSVDAQSEYKKPTPATKPAASTSERPKAVADNEVSPMEAKSDSKDTQASKPNEGGQLIETFKKCFPSDLDVSYKGDSKYKNATFYWNSRLESPAPAAVVCPKTYSEVKKAVRCSSFYTSVSVRSGGHSYEGYWQGNKDGVVVDLRNLNKVKVDSSKKLVTVQAGALLGNVMAELWKSDKGALPHGLQPTIGMGGMTLGGGFGLLARNYGLLVDQVVSMKMVNAAGNEMTVDRNGKYKDLFFALCGSGGGSYGVVTEFTYKYIKMDRNLTVARYNWVADKKNYTFILGSIMKYYDSNPPNAASHYLNLSPGGSIELGITYSDAKDHKVYTDKLETIVAKPNTKDIRSLDFIDSFQFYAGLAGKPATSTLDDLANTQPEAEQRYFKGRSGFLKKSLDEGTMKRLSDILVAPGQNLFVLIDLWGGAISQKPANSFANRNKYASVQMGATSDAMIPTLDKIYDTLKPSFDGAYQNYMDIKETNYMKSYYPGLETKLMATKTKYDPKDVFRFKQSVPTTSNAGGANGYSK
ncbi:hypothetical protein DSO57_1004267 [Entomophthora muscae]|uniref:Uncharacterized protein n=2 Tax=Entomophthora muscae TaxID=34485 RepID=A0ACC2RZG4_9FUNG|nr:hypothetical protein DSO57_1004265 [Entomophthora muscae]KAJ9055405.1 hypothetical protein DSO57_1004267 [Entomophthora muscae]